MTVKWLESRWPGRVGLCRLADQDPTFGFGLLEASLVSIARLLSVACVGTRNEDVVRARYQQGGRCQTNRRCLPPRSARQYNKNCTFSNIILLSKTYKLLRCTVVGFSCLQANAAKLVAGKISRPLSSPQCPVLQFHRSRSILGRSVSSLLGMQQLSLCSAVRTSCGARHHGTAVFIITSSETRTHTTAVSYRAVRRRRFYCRTDSAVFAGA